MRLRTLLHSILIALLLCVQQGAAAHALSHLQNGGQENSQDGGPLPHDKVCELCAVYAQTGTALISAPVPAVLPGIESSAPQSASSPLPRAFCGSYYSRAPPVLLL
jgi:hypothetical protein